MILLISEDLMMSSTVSAAVRENEGTFRFVGSVERAEVKLSGQTCELLLVDLQVANLDWDALATLIDKVPQSIAYAQHVNVAALKQAGEIPFDQVMTRGQFFAGISERVSAVLAG